MLIIASGQEATKGYLSIFFNMKVCCGFSLESPHRDDCNEYTQYTFFNVKNHSKLSEICSYGIFFQGTQERVRNNRTKGLLYCAQISSSYGSNNVAIFGNCLQKLESLISNLGWISAFSKD